MIVQIKRYHLQTGVRKSLKKCPVGLALADLRIDFVAVTMKEIFFRRHGKLKRIILPERVREWLDMWDQGVKVSPIDFQVENSYIYENASRHTV